MATSLLFLSRYIIMTVDNNKQEKKCFYWFWPILREKRIWMKKIIHEIVLPFLAALVRSIRRCAIAHIVAMVSVIDENFGSVIVQRIRIVIDLDLMRCARWCAIAIKMNYRLSSNWYDIDRISRFCSATGWIGVIFTGFGCNYWCSNLMQIVH